jgi:uncharacterized protein YkwD
MKKLIAILFLIAAIRVQAQDSADQLYLKLVNEYRANNNRSPVKYDATLDSASELHATWLISARKLGYINNTIANESEKPTHDEFDLAGLIQYGFSVRGRLSRVDSNWGKTFSGIRENAITDAYLLRNCPIEVWENQPKSTIDELVKTFFTVWITSPAHEEAILDPKVTHVGFSIKTADIKLDRDFRSYGCSVFAVKK